MNDYVDLFALSPDFRCSLFCFIMSWGKTRQFSPHGICFMTWKTCDIVTGCGHPQYRKINRKVLITDTTERRLVSILVTQEFGRIILWRFKITNQLIISRERVLEKPLVLHVLTKRSTLFIKSRYSLLCPIRPKLFSILIITHTFFILTHFYLGLRIIPLSFGLPNTYLSPYFFHPTRATCLHDFIKLDGYIIEFLGIVTVYSCDV
jgi:hypothetical protein